MLFLFNMVKRTKCQFMNSSIENLKLDKMLEPLGQAWQSGSALAA